MSEINTPRNILEQTFFFAPLKKPLSVFQMQMEYEHLRNELIASQQKCAEMIKEATQQRNRAMDAESERGSLKQRVDELVETCKQINQDKNTFFDQSCKNLQRAEAAESRLSALEQDGKIVEWIQKYKVSINQLYANPDAVKWYWHFYWPVDSTNEHSQCIHFGSGETALLDFRTAILAAMKGETK